MLELVAKFKVDFPVEDGGVICSLLEYLQKTIDFRSDFGFFCLKIFLYFGLNVVD
jgi:hypothetical protein